MRVVAGHEPTLHLTCGLPGSGKTTLARRLAVERGAQRFTKDEWVLTLGGDLFDDQLRVRMEAQLIGLAFELLSAERSCILDFGLWNREERDALRLRTSRGGAGVAARSGHRAGRADAPHREAPARAVRVPIVTIPR